MSKTIPFSYENENGEEIEIGIPANIEVCNRCLGEGKQVNPNIDSHGITSEEWNGPDWSEEEKETYLTGGYDVPCKKCNGLRVECVPDLDRFERENPEAFKVYVERVKAEDCDRAAARMERLMGA